MNINAGGLPPIPANNYGEPIREKNLCPLSLIHGLLTPADYTCNCMERAEFELLRDLPDKTINGDIRFILNEHTRPQLVFEKVSVTNSLEIELLLNGRYHPEIGTLVFNFVAQKVGPICRICVNGPLHPGAGRTHKHSLQRSRDPKINLPYAVERGELEDKTPREVWETLCQEAKILHVGNFIDP